MAIPPIEDTKVDDVSARVLVELYETGEQSLEELSPAKYKSRHRINNHLSPAGWVAKVDERQMQGATHDEHIYALTADGRRIVEENARELTHPKSFDEVADEAVEAKREAKSAKESVQGYRKKVHDSNERSKEARAMAKDALEMAEEALDLAEDGDRGWSEMAIRHMIREIIDEKLEQKRR